MTTGAIPLNIEVVCTSGKDSKADSDVMAKLLEIEKKIVRNSIDIEFVTFLMILFAVIPILKFL